PAYSLAWIVSKESFMNYIEDIDFLKLRASYGQVGDDQIPGRRWLFISEFEGSSGFRFGRDPQWIDGYAEGPMANPTISWEISKKLNIGFEASYRDGL